MFSLWTILKYIAFFKNDKLNEKKNVHSSNDDEKNVISDNMFGNIYFFDKSHLFQLLSYSKVSNVLDDQYNIF